jgi:hypothetical protein
LHIGADTLRLEFQKEPGRFSSDDTLSSPAEPEHFQADDNSIAASHKMGELIYHGHPAFCPARCRLIVLDPT